jgi:hypothetical protein
MISAMSWPWSGGSAKRTASSCQPRSAAPVHDGSVLDPHDMNDGILVDQPVDHPVGTAARREVAGQLCSLYRGEDQFYGVGRQAGADSGPDTGGSLFGGEVFVGGDELSRGVGCVVVGTGELGELLGELTGAFS